MQRVSNNSYADGGRELVLCLPDTMAQGRNTDRTAPKDTEPFDDFDLDTAAEDDEITVIFILPLTRAFF
jgi:hypothetical protein